MRATIVEWFESERLRYLAIARAAGRPPSIAIREWVAQNVSEQGMGYTERERFVSPMEELVVPAALQESPLPPSALHDRYGDACLAWNFGLGSEGAADESARKLLRSSAGSYLWSLKSLETPDLPLAVHLAEGLLELVEARDVRFVTAVPVAGLRPESERVEHKGVEIRRLTDAELGSLFRDWPSRRSWAPIAADFPAASMERCLLSVRSPSAKTQQPQGGRILPVILALHLLGFDVRGRGNAATYTEPGPSLLRGGQLIQLAKSGNSIRDITLAGLRDVVTLADLIPDETFSGPRSRKAIALHRFGTAVCEKSAADAILDFVTSLEALLLEGPGELSFRFALNGSRYLAGDLGERQGTFKALSDLYKVRSALVHGVGAPNAEDLEAQRTTARELAGRLLLKAMRQGWPTSQFFKDLALS